MLKEARMWVQALEEMLNRLAELYDKSVEEIDDEFENWYNDGGAQWDMAGGGQNAIEAFENAYRADRDDEAEQEAYDDIYQKMREYAARRDYDLQDWEIDEIIEGAEEDGDSVLDCADGALRELTEDWVADHQA